MRIALLGDIHAYRLLLYPWQMLSKRVLGQTNLWLRRRHRFDLSLLPGIIDRIRDLQPDLLLLSGDLSTTALAGEFADVVAALRPLDGRVPMLAVPGNHDRYTFASKWGGAMEKAIGPLMPASFPHVRMLNDRWRVLAMDSGVPRFLTSRGRVGREQLAAAEAALAQVPADQGVIVLCHYALGKPAPMKPMSWEHKLADEAAMLRLLESCPGKVIYLHGHVHYPWLWRRSDRLTDINAGAPCMRTSEHPRGQGFWQIDLDDDSGEATFMHHVGLEVRGVK